MTSQPLFDDHFLRAHWEAEFAAFQSGPESAALLARLRAWAGREQLNERSSETAFIQRFFGETWGYQLQGEENPAYTCRPQYEVAGAGQSGGTGFADLALGRFGTGGDGVPQVLCEFKDIRSGLDARQPRKNNNRSPVEQCFDYLQSAWQGRDRDSLTEPFFALVTDMNEFRLYVRRLGRGQFQRFVISGPATATEPTLLGDTPAAALRRFVFWRLFQPDMLLADRLAPPLDHLLRDQIVREKTIEKDFYREYRDYREFVYRTLVEANPGFTGTRGQLVRLTQRFLDRCIFILFCEDMGRVLRYPPDLLRDILIEQSQSHNHNIYGVDINPESVEITKLALWLHTAAPGKPLCSLDHNIRCGNSLVGPDFAAFYNQRHSTLFASADENERERINAFDWQAAFPEVFSHGGFDCVIGNPPYIKLQHFRSAQADTAAYLTDAKNPEGLSAIASATAGTPLYASTQSGNFDMYLPFIEKGVRLLRPEGRMGYIAPNVWMVNEYGKPLRQLVRRTRTLDRWLDFKSYQVFDEAITYTSLQFFRGTAVPALTCAFAPDGNAAAVQWENADQIPYEGLPNGGVWGFETNIKMGYVSLRLKIIKTSLTRREMIRIVSTDDPNNEHTVRTLRRTSAR